MEEEKRDSAQKAIRINWIVMAILCLPFIYCYITSKEVASIREEATFKELKSISSAVQIATTDEEQYLMFVDCTVTDSTLRFIPTGWTDDRIYTNGEEYYNNEDYWFNKDGENTYYSVAQNRVYIADVPLEIKKEINRSLDERRVALKRIKRLFTIYPKGEIGLEIIEIGRGEDYYRDEDKNVLIYTTRYTAPSYPYHPIINDLNKHCYINYADRWAELVHLEYNWRLKFVGGEEWLSANTKNISGYDVLNRHYGLKYLERSETIKPLLAKIYMNGFSILFDMQTIDKYYNKIYEGKNISELSTIYVVLREDPESKGVDVENIYLTNDKQRVELPFEKER